MIFYGKGRRLIQPVWQNITVSFCPYVGALKWYLLLLSGIVASEMSEVFFLHSSTYLVLKEMQSFRHHHHHVARMSYHKSLNQHVIWPPENLLLVFTLKTSRHNQLEVKQKNFFLWTLTCRFCMVDTLGFMY